MITTILSDFSGVILVAKDRTYTGKLNALYRALMQKNTPFDFLDHFEFNEELLHLYTKLKEKYSMNIFTTATIQKAPEVKSKLDPIFENIFSAGDYGLNKKDPQAYIFIANKLHKKPEEILYIDDQEGNVEAAKQAGMKTVVYENFEKLKEELNKTT